MTKPRSTRHGVFSDADRMLLQRLAVELAPCPRWEVVRAFGRRTGRHLSYQRASMLLDAPDPKTRPESEAPPC